MAAVVGAEGGVGVQCEGGEGGGGAAGFAIGCDEVAPEEVLLGAVEEEGGAVAGGDEVLVEAGEPGFEGEDFRCSPEGEAGVALVGVKGAAEGAGWALGGGEEDGAAGESVKDLGRDGVGGHEVYYLPDALAEKRGVAKVRASIRRAVAMGMASAVRREPLAVETTPRSHGKAGSSEAGGGEDDAGGAGGGSVRHEEGEGGGEDWGEGYAEEYGEGGDDGGLVGERRGQRRKRRRVRGRCAGGWFHRECRRSHAAKARPAVRPASRRTRVYWLRTRECWPLASV